ncbi:uncharacterized protein AKAW2_50909S [Aspergillus luchuensis]|uniref:Uncharacterized protein n=2 Tax=Aspergillus kawachii TaxID=1069201 RepID=A0A7R7WCS2_ASPKA|nr:uncharacterized protein AKAW2_50909S [Aspergillus luchuensis]OJZ82869.1 hypothetical protein ASPFODRAFT_337512 [Aspergillus luchuensis CBS 106.47]BCS00568.1 hypothetical protein AKAW2_50909S [Aspergillus luchuensis]
MFGLWRGDAPAGPMKHLRWAGGEAEAKGIRGKLSCAPECAETDCVCDKLSPAVISAAYFAGRITWIGFRADEGDSAPFFLRRVQSIPSGILQLSPRITHSLLDGSLISFPWIHATRDRSDAPLMPLLMATCYSLPHKMHDLQT